MNQYQQQHIRSQLDRDFDHFGDYHQDYREGLQNRFTSPGFWITTIICCLPLLYQLLLRLDYNLLPLPELLWNIIVYFTPSRLLDVVESYTNPFPTDPALKGIRRTHATKSEAMRRILGLDKPGGIIETVTQAGRRRLSILPGINLVPQSIENERPAGLGNWDNSCYQNSVLQGLASLDSFSEYLTLPTIEDDQEESKRPDTKMAEALRDLIETLQDPANNGKRIWTPATLKNMSSWQQQDAQEYFSKVLDEIDKEIAKVAKTIRTSQGFESDDTESENVPYASFRNPLEGLIAQRVGCTKCGYTEGLSMIPFNCLTVPLERQWEHRISDCLDDYTKLEQIAGVECGKCTLLKYQRMFTTLVDRTKDDPTSKTYLDAKDRLDTITDALEEDDYEEKTVVQKCKIPSKNRVVSTKTRQAVIARPPKSLVVHFNRSLFDEHTGHLRKNTSDVRFPRLLDLGPWCLGSSGAAEKEGTEEWRLDPESPMIASSRRFSTQKGPFYELRAVVTHHGRHDNGHYICYKKHTSFENEEAPKKTQWWRLSDDEVSRVDEDVVLGQGGAFMLFYDMIETASPISMDSISGMDGAAESKLSRKPVVDSSLPFDSNQAAVEMRLLSDLAVATSTPLPASADENLSAPLELSRSESQNGIAHTESTTAASERDDEESKDAERVEESANYRPALPIHVPQYVGGDSNSKKPGHQKLSSVGNLVMV